MEEERKLPDSCLFVIGLLSEIKRHSVKLSGMAI